MAGRRPLLIGAFAALCALVLPLEIAGAIYPGPWMPVLRLAWIMVLAALAVAGVDTLLQRGRIRQRVISDLVRRLRHPLDIQSILDMGLTRAVLLASADGGCLRTLGEGSRLEIATCIHASASYLRGYRSLPADDPAVAALLAQRDPVLLERAALTPELTGFLSQGEARAVIAVPLPGERGPEGLLAVAYRRRPWLIRDHMETLRLIATLLASAIASARTYDDIAHQARTDPLTGVASRRYFEDQYRREVARARRNGRPLTLVMIDVDRMKEINDHWGHTLGDQALQTIGESLREVRAGDVAARFGGDEFVILMPETTELEAEAVMKRVRERLVDVNASGTLPFRIRVSIGVRQLDPVEDDLLAAADAAMYAEKRRRSQPARASRSATIDPDADDELHDDSDPAREQWSGRR